MRTVIFSPARSTPADAKVASNSIRSFRVRLANKPLRYPTSASFTVKSCSSSLAGMPSTELTSLTSSTPSNSNPRWDSSAATVAEASMPAWVRRRSTDGRDRDGIDGIRFWINSTTDGMRVDTIASTWTDRCPVCSKKELIPSDSSTRSLRDSLGTLMRLIRI